MPAAYVAKWWKADIRLDAFRLPVLAYFGFDEGQRSIAFPAVRVGGEVSDSEGGALAVKVTHALHQFDALKPRERRVLDKSMGSLK